MRILITGGNGFLGKHIQKRFQDPTHVVLSPSSKALDLTNRNDTERVIREFQPDSILHMAALCGGILANKNSPADFLHVNVDMASNLFYAAKEAGCTRIYTLGSVCSYPKHCPVPFKEDNLWNGYPEETNAPYGMAKRLLLMLSQTYREQYGFSGAHLIPVNMYGEHDRFDLINSHVIPALIRKFVNAHEHEVSLVDVWGTGEATREFLYVGDAAEAISKAVLTNFDYSMPINLGTGTDIKIYSLAFLINDLVGYDGIINFTGEVSDGQPKRMLDVTRAKELLGWSAKTELRDGLIRTIEWYKKYRPTK